MGQAADLLSARFPGEGRGPDLRISYASRWRAWPGKRLQGHHPDAAADESEKALAATAPNATPQNAKGARHCCQAPCRRTAAVDPDGSSAWFRRLLRSRRQGHASFGSVVEAGRSPLTPKGSCGYQPRRPASSLRPGAGSRKPCWMLFSARSFQVPPHRLRAASGWPISRRSVSPLPKPGTCAPVSASRDIVPFRPVLLASSRTCVPLSASSRAGLRRPRNLGSAWAALRSRNLRELHIPEPFPMRFPEGTSIVSGTCKLLILLWFPAAGPFCLQV